MAKLVSNIYADALFEVAVEEDALSVIKEEFEFVIESFDLNLDFFRIYNSPQISVRERKEVISEVFEGKISEELLNFLKILIDKRRTSSLFGIGKAFNKLVDIHLGTEHVVVESVNKLSEKEMEILRKKIEELSGSNIKLVNKVNKELVGGLVIKSGDKIIDGSVTRKLAEIKDELFKIIV
ncbi:ATP synthase F1 subunit delta [Helicovermis profundi]|uniref:ATP synthase subunit delta n=1 Tax=Helicovermis profundi TaxID=3065157 RepID=A0AAU9E9R9_9FIRM|nr:F0F1 ATP synthase subunit delta [Clostridia bacterium S502]